ncbi:hypothetical protein XOC_3069 [Xanthomonas oryzae pv. oryzicola BLS256]|uniref:Uncharacterized protein n=1 Tax=Xanthomonas oryzae pv. oryzicola (strain BLS256) TaxID=383407 RepID=G7TM17_XANOB|nr:hypothetical protein XOC_3069 [Xanthomonas oryzae pv. oryzicola BLS256]QEO96719.1 hypothetical protein XOCgx_1727 [Xanthomonas oryzae pv. oryzicola]
MPTASVALRPLAQVADAFVSDLRHAADVWRAGKKSRGMPRLFLSGEDQASPACFITSAA